ncbi:acetyltransferase [Staphylococcus simiae]|uniref:acyltransferase family protein n=1 Tax=Staphylococcus simiae TaxID=308354 RepID=UPI001A979067|nr:acyltransferase family protein [Staphylococcus simiae]MBO1198187.1 acetyltransferase [Staphylococcus simiae]MBO1200269.1 acetyltransferase [Staphylococcus simiae]MBO1202567.1 acetyltransferase [Staphylococcus simiae]MBO1210155.1 acetyltransferase [Staphylococcus simiae]MBO1228711.1 acetyltransferase [Staphylococcus simiae]
MDTKDFKRLEKIYAPRYLPGLDGLRAFAVIGILIYHLNAQWLSGGFLGVDTFFVISGYLITSLLLSEYYRTGTINLIEFWKRRLKRLIPAVLFLISVVLMFTLLFKPELIIQMKKDAIAAIFYVSNWWYIAQNVDYFNQFAIEPLKHLWSLAIEEQFYVFFPPILLLLLHKLKPRKIIQTLFIISVISLVLMIVIHLLTGDNSRVYFGTDTRLQTLLLGCILAFVWPPFSLRKDVAKKSIVSLDIVGTIGFIALLTLFFIVGDQDQWIYNGGFYLISGFTLVIIATAVHPSSIFAKFLSMRLFIFIGKRSYSLYLWHYPIIVFMNSYYVQGQIPVYVYLLEIILTFAMAELSYRFIETPIRKKGFKAFTIKPKNLNKFVRTVLVIVLLVPSLIVLSGQFDALGKQHETQKKEKKTEFKTNKKKVTKKTPAKSDQTPTKNGKVDVSKMSPLLIGDSVMVDIGDVFTDKVPNAQIDGKVGRQLVDAIPIIKSQYQDYSKKGQSVIVELGTNGEFTKDQLNDLLDSFGKADVYLVSIRVPRNYESNINKLIYDAAKKRSNVHLVDWYKASGGHPEYFAYDGIHLEYSGAKALTNLIVKTIEEHEKTAK